MAGKDIAAASADFTANGDTGGVGRITIASTTPFRAKARAWVVDNDTAGVEVIIVAIVDATHLDVRLATPQPASIGTAAGDQGPSAYGLRGAQNYGTSSMAAYTLAQSAKILMPAQFIYNEPAVA